MNNDAAEAALGLLRLSPLNNTNVVAQHLIPQKRNQIPSSLIPPLSPRRPSPLPTTPSTTTTTQPLQSINQPFPDADAISCICGFIFDDGFSIACDVCSRWCHAACFDIVEGEVPEEWRCWECDPRPVNRDRAVRLQKQRVAETQAREKEREKEKDKEKDKDKGRKRERQSSPVPRRRVSAAAIEGSGNAKKKRRASIISPSTPNPPPNNHTNPNASQHGEDEPVDIDEPWSLSYVPITKDIVDKEAHVRLRRQAQAWRGVTALSPPPTNPHRTQIQPVPPAPCPSQSHTNPLVRPPTYSLHTTTPVASSSYIAPFTCSITPSASYLADPLNAYAHLGMPKPFVHLMGPPLDVALDARVVGDQGRFARNGCRPNAVLRPVLCSKAKEGNDKERHKREARKKHAEEGDETDEDDDTLTFGVFALRDLKANEEVVLGWEWDDGNAVHSLPALIESPHMFSTHHLTHLRAQMTSILHALSSTFTTCACGARARDCVLNVMAQFVDGELDAAGVGLGRTPNGSSLNGMSAASVTNANGHGTRQGQGQAVTLDPSEGSSSDKENWAHGPGVGLGIQIGTNGGVGANGTSINSNINNGLTASASTPQRKIDLGPLIGAKRGFRTREKVPFGGGVGGVEMVPSSGVGSSSGGLGSDVWASSLGTAGPSSSNSRLSTGSARTAFNSVSTAARVKTYDRKGKGRATEETNEDADVDVEGDAPNLNAMDIDKDKIPPRMRKRWMHSASHHRDRRISLPNGRSPASLLSPSGYGRTPSVSSGHSPPAPASRADWRSSASLSGDSPAPMSGDSSSPPSPESTVDGMDIDTNGVSPDVRQMPPPPMPAALDPTTISSIAFASSPSATFSKLSLLSPVPPDIRSGSPSLFGMPVPNSVRRPALSSPPPYKSTNKYPPNSDTSSTQVVVYPPRSPNRAHGYSPPGRSVRFASPNVLQGQPSLKAPHLSPTQSAKEITSLPDVCENDKVTSPIPDEVTPPAMSVVPGGQLDSTSPQVQAASPVPSNVSLAQTPETTASPTPSREPTRELTREPSPPPVPKVKMSLKDFALRKKRQREEMVAKEHVRECESPVVSGMGLHEESGDEGMHVDDDGLHDCADGGAVERKETDCDGTDLGCDVPAKKATTDAKEVQDVLMDDEMRSTVKDESIAPSAQQSAVDRIPEDPLADDRQRCESELPPLPPRSPIPSVKIVNNVDKAQTNGQLVDSTSFKAKSEILEASIPRTLIGANDRTSPFAPEPPPPPLHKSTDRKVSPPRTHTWSLPPSAPASFGLSSRPSHEDGEITSSSPPKSSHFFPRSYTPPTQPRSFQTSHPSPPNFSHASSSSTTSWRAPTPLPTTRTPLSSTSTSTSTSTGTSTPSSNGSSRPLPSGPRALRISSRPAHTPSYTPNSRPYGGSQYIPRGPSADRDRHDRDRLDWERERGWGPGPPRSRGRTGSGGWGR